MTSEFGNSYLDDSFVAVRPEFLDVFREIVKNMDAPGRCNVSMVALKANRSVAGIMVVSSILSDNNKMLRFILGLQGTMLQNARPLIAIPHPVRSVVLDSPEVYVPW